MTYHKIGSLSELMRKASRTNTDNAFECFIMLNGGLRSSKTLRYFPETDTWDICNEIDDSYEEDVSTEYLLRETHIGIALDRGALIEYVWEEAV